MHDDAALSALTKTLASHPDVRIARVAYVPGVSQAPVAWVVGDNLINGPELRQYVRPLVVEHAVPDVVAILHDFPQDDEGDGEDGVRPWQLASLESAYRFVSPRSAIERWLAEFCSVLLSVPEVGVLDDFIEMGGDSLFAISLLTEIQNIYGVEIDLAELYELATIEQLSIAIERARGN